MADVAQIRTWFMQEIFPHEGDLLRFIGRNWKIADEVPDIRQEIYERLLDGVRQGFPQHGRAYMFTVARNVIMNRARHARIVSFEQVSNLEMLDRNGDMTATDRHIDARDALRRTQDGLDALPARCREVVRLRKVEGLSTRETAERMGVTTHTVERQLVLGMRAMTDFLLGGSRAAKPARRLGRRRQTS